MTGPGCAATTLAATLKSESFFSISRDVYSRVSADTVSCCAGGSSSSDSGGSSVSAGRSMNSVDWRSATARSEGWIRATGGSIRIGAGSSSKILRFSWTCSSRTLAAASPMRRSLRAETACTARRASHSIAVPTRSKIASQDQPDHRLKPAAIRPSSASVPPTAPSASRSGVATMLPSTPPGANGSSAPMLCSRADSRATQPTISIAKPSQRSQAKRLPGSGSSGFCARFFGASASRAAARSRAMPRTTDTPIAPASR